MRGQQPTEAGETRAEVARRRLAQLNASFLASADPPSSSVAVGEATADDLSSATVGHRAETARRRPALHPVHLRVVAALAVAAGVLLTWWVLAERPRVADVEDPVDLTAPAASESGDADADADADGGAGQEGEVVVDVAGKVKKPGIVVLPAGARVHEAIEKAGGLKGRVDTTSLNLARVLTDGEQVLVGVEAAGPPAPSSGAGAGGGGGPGPVNLNTATQEELMSLPGVGPVTAEAIIGWREENGSFSSVDDLLEVSGIGEKTLADLRERVTV
ncbi:helix-hairpin-helix domain-containing protein [Aeromicrobium sp. CTD01-1L150]|uniref:helix-hairpin-helix domain-containing protein n=1 Tax=Aeromicrobium sp. CTD01-1L150 TaxID=3341830 RepID=UPI0035BFD79F